uniref:RHS repeat domain-containing protein n=1 Tax=Flavobacterium sp. TaxID=239 RepID=UPI002624E5D7
TKFFYVYNYTDHLGNVRMSYTDNGVAVPKILEENHYYPFGLKHENYASERFERVKETNGELFVIQPTERREWQYKYNGKEWQDELGLNFYDYGARNYDAAIGRWMNVDPLAEVSRRFSPYVYALNNPIYFLDPDGMKVINGNEAERNKRLNERDKKKAEFDSKYSSTNLKRRDFNSRKEFKSYKSAKEGLAKAESEYKSAEYSYQQVQATIDEFKNVDPEGFAQVDNLKNAVTGSEIDVVVKFGGVDPNSGGAETSPSVWPASARNQDLGGDGNINITFDGSSKLGRGETIAHEFGHAVGIANAPYDSFYSALVARNQAALFGKPASCQHPDNRNETYAKTAMDWQDRFIALLKK